MLRIFNLLIRLSFLLLLSSCSEYLYTCFDAEIPSNQQLITYKTNVTISAQGRYDNSALYNQWQKILSPQQGVEYTFNTSGEITLSKGAGIKYYNDDYSTSKFQELLKGKPIELLEVTETEAKDLLAKLDEYKKFLSRAGGNQGSVLINTDYMNDGKGVQVKLKNYQPHTLSYGYKNNNEIVNFISGSVVTIELNKYSRWGDSQLWKKYPIACNFIQDDPAVCLDGLSDLQKKEIQEARSCLHTNDYNCWYRNGIGLSIKQGENTAKESLSSTCPADSKNNENCTNNTTTVNKMATSLSEGGWIKEANTKDIIWKNTITSNGPLTIQLDRQFQENLSPTSEETELYNNSKKIVSEYKNRLENLPNTYRDQEELSLNIIRHNLEYIKNLYTSQCNTQLNQNSPICKFFENWESPNNPYNLITKLKNTIPTSLGKFYINLDTLLKQDELILSMINNDKTWQKEEMLSIYKILKNIKIPDQYVFNAS